MDFTILNIILIVFGIVSILSPKMIWKIKGMGRYDREEEATPFMINIIRITGIVALLAGVLL